MSEDLITEFIQRLNQPDPPHALLLLGVYSASNWMKGLEEGEKKIIYSFMEKQLNLRGDLPIKELIVKVLQNVGGHDSIGLIDKIISEGESIHGKYLVSDALNAKSKLTNV